MDENHLILIVSMLCITQLMLLQAILRLKVKVYRLERENEQKKRQK